MYYQVSFLLHDSQYFIPLQVVQKDPEFFTNLRLKQDNMLPRQITIQALATYHSFLLNNKLTHTEQPSLSSVITLLRLCQHFQLKSFRQVIEQQLIPQGVKFSNCIQIIKLVQTDKLYMPLYEHSIKLIGSNFTKFHQQCKEGFDQLSQSSQMQIINYVFRITQSQEEKHMLLAELIKLKRIKDLPTLYKDQRLRTMEKINRADINKKKSISRNIKFTDQPKYFKLFNFQKILWLLLFRKLNLGGKTIFLGQFIHIVNEKQALERYDFDLQFNGIQKSVISDIKSVQVRDQEIPQSSPEPLAAIAFKCVISIAGKQIARTQHFDLICSSQVKPFTIFQLDYSFVNENMGNNMTTSIYFVKDYASTFIFRLILQSWRNYTVSFYTSLSQRQLQTIVQFIGQSSAAQAQKFSEFVGLAVKTVTQSRLLLQLQRSKSQASRTTRDSSARRKIFEPNKRSAMIEKAQMLKQVRMFNFLHDKALALRIGL